MLEALDRELVHPDQWEAVPGRGLLKLVSGNLASLKQTQDFLGCLLDFGLKGPHPLLDGGCGPCFWGVVLEGGVGRLKQVWERWWLVRCGRGSAGAASVFLEFLPGAGKIIGGGFERSDG